MPSSCIFASALTHTALARTKTFGGKSFRLVGEVSKLSIVFFFIFLLRKVAFGANTDSSCVTRKVAANYNRGR